MREAYPSDANAGETGSLLPDLVAFGIGLALAWAFKWETTDLVWSLWTGSLVLGYLSILSAIAGAGVIGLALLRRMRGTAKRWPLILGGIAAGAFFLGFFSLHFCGFHAGHAIFLSGFFPLEGLPRGGFSGAFMNPVRLWQMVFAHLIRPYGLFLIPVAIAERRHVFRALVRAIQIVRENDPAGGGPADRSRKSGESNLAFDAIGRPYLNVVRMHILIFFFAFAHFLKIDSFAVYAVVYFVYFFPWRILAHRRPPQAGILRAPSAE